MPLLILGFSVQAPQIQTFPADVQGYILATTVVVD
jgi:hypothetical protein